MTFVWERKLCKLDLVNCLTLSLSAALLLFLSINWTCLSREQHPSLLHSFPSDHPPWLPLSSVLPLPALLCAPELRLLARLVSRAPASSAPRSPFLTSSVCCPVFLVILPLYRIQFMLSNHCNPVFSNSRRLSLDAAPSNLEPTTTEPRSPLLL